MGSKTIILHIGSPKCGSSYLQHVLSRNRDNLLESGVYYPAGDGRHPGNASNLPNISPSEISDFFNYGNHTTILSHEDLFATAGRCSGFSDAVKALKINIHILVFIRPFSEFMFGDYSQHMKQRFYEYVGSRSAYSGLDFCGFVDSRSRLIKPAEFIKGWCRMFSDDSVSINSHKDIRPTVERLIGSDVVKDWNVGSGLSNPSLRVYDCDRLSEMISDPMIPVKNIENYYKSSYHNIGLPDPGKTSDRIEYIENVFRPQNAALLKFFGYDNRSR